MGTVTQRQPQIRTASRACSRITASARAPCVLDGVDHDAVVLLPDDQDLLRLRSADCAITKPLGDANGSAEARSIWRIKGGPRDSS